MRRRGIVVAIDGPAGAGKSTTARSVAERLGYVYLDTGAMYRALGVAVLRAGLDPDDAHAVEQLAGRCKLDLILSGTSQKTLLDDEDVSDVSRTSEASSAASRVAAHAGVRRVLVSRQQRMGEAGGIVLEGRDTGTAVFPDAELKVFLRAGARTRALRRQAELVARGEDVDLEDLVTQIRERDRRDEATQRRAGGWPARGAIEVDTTGMSIAQQVDRVVGLALERGACAGGA